MASTLLEYSYTIITIVLLAYFLRRSLNAHTTTTTQIKSWIIFGVIFNLYSLSWLYTVYPLMWMKEGALQLLGIATLHGIISFFSGLCFFIVGFAFRKNIHARVKPFVFALLLTLSEIMRSIILSLLYYGDSSRIGLNWGAGTIGNALSTTPFIEYAYFGGIYALTFILGYIVYACISKKHITLYKTHILLVCLTLIGVHYCVPVNGPSKEITVATISTNFESPEISESKEEILQEFERKINVVDTLTMSLASSSPEIIAYPEDTRYIATRTQEKNKTLKAYFAGTLFVDGGTRNIPGGLSNYTVFYKPLWDKTPIRGKSFLMPFNEYLPNIFRSIFSLFIGKDELQNYEAMHTYTPEYTPKVLIVDHLRVGTLICSEILSYTTVNSVSKDKPNIIFHQAHLNVFHNNPWFIMHMRSFSKITAAQMRIPFIGSSNGAPSFAINQYGRIVHITPIGFSTTLYKVFKENIELVQ